jgi:hypothetical protein
MSRPRVAKKPPTKNQSAKKAPAKKRSTEARLAELKKERARYTALDKYLAYAVDFDNPDDMLERSIPLHDFFVGAKNNKALIVLRALLESVSLERPGYPWSGHEPMLLDRLARSARSILRKSPDLLDYKWQRPLTRAEEVVHLCQTMAAMIFARREVVTQEEHCSICASCEDSLVDPRQPYPKRARAVLKLMRIATGSQAAVFDTEQFPAHAHITCLDKDHYRQWLASGFVSALGSELRALAKIPPETDEHPSLDAARIKVARAFSDVKRPHPLKGKHANGVDYADDYAKAGLRALGISVETVRVMFDVWRKRVRTN